jgi:cytochrome P450
MSSVATDSALPLAILAGSGTLIYLAGRKMFGHDPREPPLAPSSIPVVGHLVGLTRSTFKYYVELSEQIRVPVFTMALPGQKIYIVTSPGLVQVIQKQHKILAFPPISVRFSSTVCGSSKEAQAILEQNVNGDDGEHGISMEIHAAMHQALKPGPLLDDMNRDMIREIAKSLDALEPAPGSTKKIGLYAWLRDAITLATTRSVYGPLNPYEDKAIVDAFWVFEGGLMSILVGVMPSLTARKPIAARDKVAKAFEAYLRAGGVEQASTLAKLRYKAGVNNRLPLEDIARFEVGNSIAIMVNTVPAAFWTLFLVFSHPGLADELRAEIDACIETAPDTNTKTVDITTLKSACPLLLSAYQEALRHRSMGTSVREVMEDTYLDQWLLKKGAMLQIPSRVIHQDTSLWGPDAAEYNPRRFLPENRQNRPKDVCFRAFGGGKTLCPGRHFATNEVLAVVAVFLARLDMKPVGTAGWKTPSCDNTNVAAVVMEPDVDVEVEVSVRKGMEGVKWQVRLDGKGDKVFAMVTEDQEPE